MHSYINYRLNLHILPVSLQGTMLTSICWPESVLSWRGFWDPGIWSGTVGGWERFAFHCTSLFHIWIWLLQYTFGFDVNWYRWGGTSCRSHSNSSCHSCVYALSLAEQVEFTLVTHGTGWSVFTVVVINCWCSTLDLEDSLTGSFIMYCVSYRVVHGWIVFGHSLNLSIGADF